MSKTFAGNSTGKMMTAYSKRFAASVIGFAHKYRYDPFFRTEINIIGLQVVFALGVVALLVISFSVLDEGMDARIMQTISENMQNGSPAELSSSVLDQIQHIRTRSLSLVVVIIVIATLVFAYIVARITLSPTRDALASQKRFIGNVAHELRTPISIIKTNTEVALMAKDVSSDLREILKSTVEELDRTSEIINNLLSLSASVRPERMEFKDVDLGEVVRHTVQQLRGLSEAKHLEVEARLGERRLVFGNAVALEQIVTNILKNAITHTPQDGRIVVTVEPARANQIEFTVRDSGSGIPRKDLFHIFEPYYRGDPSRKRGGSGSGLGLTIVAELVKLHNGKITVRSIEQRGTTIIVTLPVGKQKDFDGVAEQRHEDASEIAVDFSHNHPRNK